MALMQIFATQRRGYGNQKYWGAWRHVDSSVWAIHEDDGEENWYFDLFFSLFPSIIYIRIMQFFLDIGPFGHVCPLVPPTIASILAPWARPCSSRQRVGFAILFRHLCKYVSVTHIYSCINCLFLFISKHVCNRSLSSILCFESSQTVVFQSNAMIYRKSTSIPATFWFFNWMSSTLHKKRQQT